MRMCLVRTQAKDLLRTTLALKQWGHAVDAFDDLDDAREAVLSSGYDVVIVDLDGLEDDGIAFIRWVQVTRTTTLKMVCASRAHIDLLLVAMNQGADDFLCKPIDMDELQVRISALEGRKTAKQVASEVAVDYGPLRIDPKSQQIWLNGEALDLTPRERSVLQVLLRHRGNVVSKDYIASRIFSMEDEAATSAIEIYVHRLRKKVSDPKVAIKTVRGLGYVLELAAAAEQHSQLQPLSA